MTSSSTHLTIVGSVLTIALVFALIPQIAFAVMLPIKLGNTSVMFIDFRDENGSPNEESAGKSTGLLYRWLSDSNTVEGLYGYVDQNKSPNNNRLKRFVLGFESLSNHWSYRINGYIPTKDMKRIEGSGKLYIKGHNVYEEQSGYYERARPGLELSASYTIPYLNNTKAHIKGYTFWSRHASSVTGGSIRVEKQINDHVNLVTSLQHDSIEGWDNYAGIKFNYKFGGVKKMPSDHNIFKKMAVPIQKLDEVPSYRVYKLNYEGKPDKEQPLDFFGKRHDKLIFVDNEAQSVGDGTRENPYNNLEDAEKNSKNRELIYVLYGDGTSNGYGSGFTMKEGQSLVGSGVGLSLRGKTLIAPKMSSKGKPIMTKITNKRGAIVKLANKSSVAGFEFNVRYIGIYGWDIDRVSIFNNMFYSELPNTSDTAIKLANEGNITDTTANIYYNRFHSLGTGIQVLSSGKPESTILKDSLINLNIFQNIFGYTTFPINLRFNAIAKHWLILKANRFSHNIEGLSIYSNKASVGSRIIGNIFNRTYRCAICFKMGSYEEDSR
ncbi:MAG: inverse autotransporter beta domain-containing protein, partial [Candidatus Thiodiazotropha sp. (ex Lucinoma kastoroae)]|nr:inverse autotransporter beta domain-containing protein [Candidatus Thiodiazotropha sp. (ex Lucinoma kastoroae)]